MTQQDNKNERARKDPQKAQFGCVGDNNNDEAQSGKKQPIEMEKSSKAMFLYKKLGTTEWLQLLRTVDRDFY